MNAGADQPIDEDGGAEPGGGTDMSIDIPTGQAIPEPLAPDGEELISEDEVVERVRVSGRVESRIVGQQRCRGDDELPVVVEQYRAFVEGGRRRR